MLTQEEKDFICNTNQACLTSLEVFDFDTFYSSYAREKRPQETYDPACQACSSLFENYDFADACDATLRDVYESCDDCSASFNAWRQGFDKKEFCSGLFAAETELKSVLRLA